MRMRRKKNLFSRLERVSELSIKDPESLKGQWLLNFPGYNTLHIEIGCGKGKFTVETAESNPDILYIAIERYRDALITAMERAAGKGLRNVFFINLDASRLNDVFDSGEVDRIYINFCDPWPSKRHIKRRLTSPLFLKSYLDILKSCGDIHFKTDNMDLFKYSLEQFKLEGFSLTNVTENLHENEICGVMTDYEAKFHAEGKQICRLEARPALRPVNKIVQTSLEEAEV